MTVYRGIVRGKTVILTEPVDLPDGAVVEVRVAVPAPAKAEEREREEAFMRHLLEIGLIWAIPPKLPDPPGLDRTPIPVEGRPVSETLIEDRR
jgi:hypothetical protein